MAESDRKVEFEADPRFEIRAFLCISLQPDSAPTEPVTYPEGECIALYVYSLYGCILYGLYGRCMWNVLVYYERR